MTAAHKTLPFGTRVRVTSTANNKSVVVTINDRGPYAGDRVLDLSAAAATQLGFKDSGVANVKAEVLGEVETEEAGEPVDESEVESEASQEPPKTAQPVKPSTTAEEEEENVTEVESEFTLATTSSEASEKIGELAKSLDRYNPLFQAPNLDRLSTKDVKIADDSILKIPKLGEVWLQENAAHIAQLNAILKGDTTVARGNTVSQVSPGQGKPSGVVLDFKNRRSTFVEAKVQKNSGIRLKSGYGSITVKGWSVNDKQTVSGTAVATSPPLQHPTGVIQSPAWESVKLDEPIIPGSPYTWGDATRNGSRIPEDQNVMDMIVEIAGLITQLTNKYTNGKKWQINSWYRDPATNAAIPNASANSFHMSGGAVDFRFTFESYLDQGEMQLYSDLNPTHPGGLAFMAQAFVHLDTGRRTTSESPQYARWEY
jgi:rare lipoprotein A